MGNISFVAGQFFSDKTSFRGTVRLPPLNDSRFDDIMNLEYMDTT